MAAGGALISSTLPVLVLLPIVYPGSAAADERPTFPAWLKRDGAA